jgi:polysaccharide biosynthesis protein PslH
MTVLFVATRSPWPPIDGGRVLMAHTIHGLLARGHRVVVIAPAGGPAADAPAHERLEVRLVAGHRRSPFAAAARVWFLGRPLLLERHAHPAVAREVRARIRTGVDVVHVEQVQALHAVEGLRGRIPVVLRAENVESALWTQAARLRLGRAGGPAAIGVRRGERRCLEDHAGIVAAVCDRDTTALRRMAPLARVETVRIPMPASLPAGSTALAGAPAVVLFAGRWWPNRDGARWFLRTVWAEAARALPEARLHVFGEASAVGDGVVVHPAPADAVEAFAPGSILVAPARVASGASVKVLEAFARGVPVVATSIVAAGVDPAAAALGVADTPDAFVEALRRIAGSDEVRARMVAAGRALLAAHHDPSACAAALEAVYAAAIAPTRRPA